MESTEEHSLVQQLRSTEGGERRCAAKRLAQLGTPQAVDALLAIADDPESSLDDQLLAIECLGETRAPKARSYLQALLRETIAEVPQSYSWGSGEVVHHETYPDEEHFCPTAQGPLRYALTYIVQLYEKLPDAECVTRRPDADIAADRESISQSRVAFQVVRAALEKLK